MQRGGTMMKIRLVHVPGFMLCCFAAFARAEIEGTVFLERGHRGKVPCPAITSHRVTLAETVAMYWYYGTTSTTALLISSFRGRVAPQNGISHGIYDIDSEFSLVIENVTAKDEGIYYFKLKPRLKMTEEGQVEVCDKVVPSRPPAVTGCNQSSSSAAPVCEARIQSDATAHNLTCVVNQVKPAVHLRWIRLYLDGFTELNASLTVRPVVLPANTGSSLRNNTYTTSTSIQVTSVEDGAEYVCEATGPAVANGSQFIRVRFRKTHHTTATYDFNSTVSPVSTDGVGYTGRGEEVPTAGPKLPERYMYFALTVAAVAMSSLSIVLSVSVCFYIVRQRRKGHEYKHPLSYAGVPTSC